MSRLVPKLNESINRDSSLDIHHNQVKDPFIIEESDEKILD